MHKCSNIFGRFHYALAARLVCVLLSPLLLCGCGWLDGAFGLQNGYLLHGQDVLVLPGQKAVLKARLQSGGLLHDERNRRLRFSLAGAQIAEATTDYEGFAETEFTPREPGDYMVSVEVLSDGLGHKPPPPAELLVACRKSDQPIIVIDLDGTLVASGFEEVLTGDPDPLADSVEVMKRLAGEFTIMYLTHRPVYFGPKSKRWLVEHGFPRGPVILSRLGDLVTGSRRYKTEQLEVLRERFSMLQIGIGNSPSDSQAYCHNNMTAYMILDTEELDDAIYRYKLENELTKLPAMVQVVFGWRDIEEGIFSGRTFTTAAAIERLKNMPSSHALNSNSNRPATGASK